jgi:hypothetical protein
MTGAPIPDEGFIHAGTWMGPYRGRVRASNLKGTRHRLLDDPIGHDGDRQARRPPQLDEHREEVDLRQIAGSPERACRGSSSHFAQAHVPEAPDPLATQVAAPLSGTVGQVVPAAQVGNEHCALSMA